MNLYYEYNKPVRFDGDIIITDPCYLMRGEKCNPLCLSNIPEEYRVSYPEWADFFPYGDDEEKYPDLKEVMVMFDIDDDFSEITTLILKKKLSWDLHSVISHKYSKTKMAKVKRSEIYRDGERRYKEALNKYYKYPHDDEDYTDSGRKIGKLGITTSLISDTIYGDWGCTTVNSDTKEKLGTFCADAGEVGVFLLDEIKTYWPEKVEKMLRDDDLFWATIIKDFHGDIQIVNEVNGEPEISVVGRGNINFKTIQTSL